MLRLAQRALGNLVADLDEVVGILLFFQLGLQLVDLLGVGLLLVLELRLETVNLLLQSVLSNLISFCLFLTPCSISNLLLDHMLTGLLQLLSLGIQTNLLLILVLLKALLG